MGCKGVYSLIQGWIGRVPWFFFRLLVGAIFLGFLSFEVNAQPLVNPQPLEVKVEGVKGAMKKNVMLFLTIQRFAQQQKEQEEQEDKTDLTYNQILRLSRLAPVEINEALRSFGYYDPVIKTDIQQRKKDRWLVRFEIDLREPARIAGIDIQITGEGSLDPIVTRAREGFPLKLHDIMDHRKYEAGKQSLLEISRQHGYLEAGYSITRFTVDPDQKTAVIDLHMDTGRLYQFGEVHFSDGDIKESLLRRYVSFTTGDRYENGLLTDLQFSLNDSRFFRNVQIEPKLHEVQDREVPIYVQLDPYHAWQYRIGVGYGTDTGPRLSTEIENPHLNRHGHRFNSEMNISPIKSELNTVYSIPAADPRTDRLDFPFSLQWEDNDDRESFKQKGGVRLVRVSGAWERVLRISLEHERFDVGKGPVDTFLLMPGGALSYTRSSNAGFLRQGFRGLFDMQGASEGLISDVSFAQARLESKWIHRPWNSGRFLNRVAVGATLIDEPSDLPLSLRYLTGGDTTIRGFAYEDLGPRNEENVIEGGRYLLEGSVEYEQHLRGNWAVATFFDFGNAVNEWEPLRRSAGMGLRWKTIIGMVRLDIARPVDSSDDGLRLHLTLGPDL